MRSLDKLLTRDDRIYYPTHGPEILEPQKLVATFKEHRREREEKILECLKSGNETIDQMVQTVYDDVPKNLHAAAARSLFATVIYLVEEESVEAADGLSLNGRYKIK